MGLARCSERAPFSHRGGCSYIKLSHRGGAPTQDAPWVAGAPVSGAKGVGAGGWLGSASHRGRCSTQDAPWVVGAPVSGAIGGWHGVLAGIRFAPGAVLLHKTFAPGRCSYTPHTPSVGAPAPGAKCSPGCRNVPALFAPRAVLLHQNRDPPRTVGAPAPGAKTYSRSRKCARPVRTEGGAPTSKPGPSPNRRSTRPGCENVLPVAEMCPPCSHRGRCSYTKTGTLPEP